MIGEIKKQTELGCRSYGLTRSTKVRNFRTAIFTLFKLLPSLSYIFVNKASHETFVIIAMVLYNKSANIPRHKS